MPLPRTIAFTLCILFCGLASAPAQTEVEISWGSSIFEEKMILSDGTAIDPANLIIEFGSFDSSFDPDHSNMSEWLTQWRVFDAVTDSDPATPTNDADPNDSFTNESGGTDTARFGGTAHLLADSTSDSEDATPSYAFSPGEQAYLFIRTSDEFSATSEWLLVTSNNDSQHVGDAIWEFPVITGGQPQFSLAWWLDDADTAVFGAVAGGEGDGFTGLGSFTDTSTDFVLRLHSIPEPNSSILALIPAAVLLLRRRRPKELYVL